MVAGVLIENDTKCTQKIEQTMFVLLSKRVSTMLCEREHEKGRKAPLSAYHTQNYIIVTNAHSTSKVLK
jgi:hypothetical protein